MDKGSDTDTRNQVEKTIDKIQGSLHDRSMIEKSQKDEIAQQLQLLKGMNLSLCVRKLTIWVPTRSDTNRAVQSQEKVRGWKLWI